MSDIDNEINFLRNELDDKDDEIDLCHRELVKLNNKAKMRTQECYDSGYQNGKQDGISSGDSQGYNRGRNEGYDKGKNNGFQKGKSQGYESGYQRGYDDGFVEGQNYD